MEYVVSRLCNFMETLAFQISMNCRFEDKKNETKMRQKFLSYLVNEILFTSELAKSPCYVYRKLNYYFNNQVRESFLW